MHLDRCEYTTEYAKRFIKALMKRGCRYHIARDECVNFISVAMYIPPDSDAEVDALEWLPTIPEGWKGKDNE